MCNHHPINGSSPPPIAPWSPHIDPGASFGSAPYQFTQAGERVNPGKQDAGLKRKIDWDDAEISIKKRKTSSNGAVLLRHVMPKKTSNEKVALFSDIHCHMHDYSGKGHLIEDIFKVADEAGVEYLAMSPIPTTLVSLKNDQERFCLYGEAHCCGENYYIPENLNGDIEELSSEAIKEISSTTELRVDASVDDNMMTQLARAVKTKKIPPKYLDRVDLGLTGIHLGSPRVTQDILKTLWRMKDKNDDLQEIMGKEKMGDHRLRFTHIGEVTLRKELVETMFSGTQADLKENIAPTRQAMRLAGVIGMPWILHCDVDKPESLKTKSEKNQAPQHLEDIKALMRSCPNTEIIWAHAGGLGRFVHASENHVNDLHKLMKDPTLKHVKLDISWDHVATQLTRDPKTVKVWAQFLCKYQDRILFGSDALAPQSAKKWTGTYDIYKEKLVGAMNAIDPGATQKIMLGNYEKVMLTARKRVDAFVDHVLPQIIDSVLSIYGQKDVDVKAIWKLRERIFSEKAAGDPELQKVIDYYRNRDLPLPEARTHWPLLSSDNRFPLSRE